MTSPRRRLCPDADFSQTPSPSRLRLRPVACAFAQSPPPSPSRLRLRPVIFAFVQTPQLGFTGFGLRLHLHRSPPFPHHLIASCGLLTLGVPQHSRSYTLPSISDKSVEGHIRRRVIGHHLLAFFWQMNFLPDKSWMDIGYRLDPRYISGVESFLE